MADYDRALHLDRHRDRRGPGARRSAARSATCSCARGRYLWSSGSRPSRWPRTRKRWRRVRRRRRRPHGARALGVRPGVDARVAQRRGGRGLAVRRSRWPQAIGDRRDGGPRPQHARHRARRARAVRRGRSRCCRRRSAIAREVDDLDDIVPRVHQPLGDLLQCRAAGRGARQLALEGAAFARGSGFIARTAATCSRPRR